MDDTFSLDALLAARQTVSPRRLVAPGPEGAQLAALLAAAGHAPDHGCLLPWRLVLVPQAARAALGEAFAQALLARDPEAGAEAVARAREKAARAPLLLLLVVRLVGGDAAIGADERLVSAGCAVQNLLLAATAQGFGSALASGKALQSAPLRALFALGEGERALCFINIGSVEKRRPLRARPGPECYVELLQPGQGRRPWME